MSENQSAEKLLPSPEDVEKSQPPEGWQETKLPEDLSPQELEESKKPILEDWRKEQAEKGQPRQMPAPGEWVPVGEKTSQPGEKSSQGQK